MPHAKTLLLAQVLSAACWLGVGLSSAAQADEARKVIGVLTPAAQPTLRDKIFLQGMRELGWIEGKNLEMRYARDANDARRLKALAEGLVKRKVDLILAQSTPAVAAAKAATHSIPIVSISADPVSNRFVASLAKPGGNITGISMMMPQLAGKRLELLRELQPSLSRVGFLGYAPDPSHKLFAHEAEEAGKHIAIEVRRYIVPDLEHFDEAFAQMKKDRIDALIVQPLFVNQLNAGPAVVRLATAAGLLTISDGDGFAEAGGLLFYGPDPVAIYRRLAVYVDRVLKGARPAEMPMEQPETFLLRINLATAQKLGIRVPQTVLLRADRVIE
jgi:putative ABC transport system substrate-binding protein